MNTICNTLSEILCKNYFISAFAISPNKRLYNDLGLNSLEFLELVGMVEQYFNIQIPDHELDRIVTVADITACIKNYSLALA